MQSPLDLLRAGVGRAVTAVVGFAERRPWTVLVSALFVTLAFWTVAARTLEVRTGLLELLPHDSPGLRTLEAQRARALGGSSLVVVVESPDPDANRRFVDAIGATLRARLAADDRVAYVETGTAEVRDFFAANKWLYASLDELEDVDARIDAAVARQSGLVEDLTSDDANGSANAGANGKRLGVRDEWERWNRRVAEKDPYPSGYFATNDGQLYGVRIVTRLGLGDPRGDALVREVRALVAARAPASFHPSLAVGLAGELATTETEKAAILSDAVWATAAATLLILVGIALFFRSAGALVVIGLPAAFGVAAAYAFAAAVHGHVNMVGAFLGAIILGNGINYPIVLLARYGDFRGRGMTGAAARLEAVRNAFRAELVGALVAAIAYGSLALTEFRGFRQFGVVGFVGMLLVWLSIVPLVPAAIVVFERHESRLPRFLSLAGARRERGRFMHRVGALACARPLFFLGAAAAVTGMLATPLVTFLRDPWEYDFGRLGSRHSDAHTVGWSDKADRIFGKGDIAGALILANTPEQAPLLKQRILERDRADPEGTLLKDVVAIEDFLPGDARDQERKLAVLARIRDRLGDGVVARLDADERDLARALRPPQTLRVIGPTDVPPQLARRFEERDGRIGAVLYVQPRPDLALADGHIQLRLSKTCDEVPLGDGTIVHTASHATVVAEILKSMRRDGPRVSFAVLAAVALVVGLATHRPRGAWVVLSALAIGVTCMLGFAAWTGERLNYVNFIALPITCGIGCEYPFNLYDRARLLNGDVVGAVARSAGAVALCSFTTIVGYGSLVLSDVQALESFGRLAVVGELACVLSAVLLVPAQLALARRVSALCTR